MKCNLCGYSWVTRVDDPKACPECKSRLGRQQKTEEVKNAVN